MATKGQQMYNLSRRTDNVSGFKGVHYCAGLSKPWRAEISKDRKRYILGYFSTPEEAHRIYCEKAKELFGEFARSV